MLTYDWEEQSGDMILYGDCPSELWDQVMDINLKSHFICTKESIPSMQRNGRGVVVNVASEKADFITGQPIRIDGGLGIMIGDSI